MAKWCCLLAMEKTTGFDLWRPSSGFNNFLAKRVLYNMPEPRGNVATSSWLYVLLLSLIWWNIYWINEFVCSWVWIFPTYTYPTGKIHTQLPVWRLKKKKSLCLKPPSLEYIRIRPRPRCKRSKFQNILCPEFSRKVWMTNPKLNYQRPAENIVCCSCLCKKKGLKKFRKTVHFVSRRRWIK